MESEHVGLQPILSDKEREMFEGYDFPFENLVLEGGGAKLFGGVGTVLVLEELGVLAKMKRFGGTSAGSFLATMISLGYSGHEIEELMAVDMGHKMEDDFPLFKNIWRLINLVTRYGIHNGTTMKKWLGELVARKMDGNPDATFWELYEKTGKELVVTSTELMQKECVYYHVKTTPDRPIREAVFMSMSIPGFLRPTIHTDAVKDQQVFVDGGVIYNYPIHCFDGWFLSPGEENDLIKKHIELGEKDMYFWKEFGRFTGRNDKTIGLIVYGNVEEKALSVDLDKRNQRYIEKNIPEAERRTRLPDTKLSREHTKNNPTDEKETAYRRLLKAQLRFEQAIAEKVGITPGEAHDVADGNADEKDDHPFDDEDAALLYGRGVDAKTAIETHMAKLQDAQDGADGKVECQSFDRHMVVKSSTGLEFMRQKQINSQSYAPRRIGNVGDFLASIVNFYGNQMMRLNQRPTDLERTIGVDVDYVTTGDYKMEDGDRSFLLQQSKIACLAFLEEYINKNELTKKTNN